MQIPCKYNSKCGCKSNWKCKASAKANATKITNASTNISANAMRLMQKPMQLQNASTQANATKATMQVPMSISANAMRLL